MNSKPQRAERRSDPLTKTRIVDAAIGLLDTEGESALTFRALTTLLATGNGAIYHHVANKSELLSAAAERIVDSALERLRKTREPPTAQVRATALGLFDAIDAHPWLGVQLTRDARQPAMLEIFEAFGGRLRAAGTPDTALFNAAFAVVNYVIGAAVQNASNGRPTPDGGDRFESLLDTSAQWSALDAERFPFLRAAAAQLAEHDDREQFLAGVDLILKGVAEAT